MAQGGGVDNAQVITWIVAGAGIGINLIWNWANRRHTNDTAERIRIEQRQLDRWDRLRSRIEAALVELVSDLKNAHILVAKADPSKPETILLINALGLDINVKQDALATALENADRADFCHGTDWVNLANGKSIYDGETSWDMVNTVLSSATKATTEQVNFLKRLKPYADDIDQVVRDALEAQDDLLAPKPRPRFSLWRGFRATQSNE